MTNGQITQLANDLDIVLAWFNARDLDDLPPVLLDVWVGLVSTTRNWRQGYLSEAVQSRPVQRVTVSDGLTLVWELEQSGALDVNGANLLRALLLRLGQAPDCCGTCGECGASHGRLGECPQ